MAVNIIIDSKFDDKGIKDAQRQLQNMASQAAKRVAQVGAAVAAAGAVAAGKLAVDAVSAASDFEESVNAVNVAFGEAAQGVLEIGENASTAMGLSANEFNQAAVRFSAFAERVVGEGGDVAGFIGDVSQRAADFASVFNIEVSEALQVFQSGLAGEAEPLKRFGINLLQSEVAAFAMANGIAESSAAMTESEKVQARYGLLLEQTAKTQGDFRNTSDSLANSQRILRAEISDLQVEIGKALLPVAKDLVTTFANNLLPRLEEFSNFLSSPEGIQSVKEFGAQVENVVNFLLDFAGFIADNLGAIVGLGIAIAGATVAVKLYGVAVQVAAVKQAALNATIALNPFGLLAIGIAAVTAALGVGAAALINYNTASDETNETAEDFRAKIQAQHEELQRLEAELESGAISQKQYGREVYYVTANLEELRTKLARTYNFTEAQTDASYRARDAALANRFANDNLAPSISNTGDAYYGLATAATNARLGIESVTIAEEAQRQLNYALTLGIGDQQTAMELYEQILARVTARVKFQTVEQAEFNEKVDEAGRALGLVVPAASGASSAVGSLGSSFDSTTESILKATEAANAFTQATPGSPGPGGLFEVTLPGGGTALANLDGIQEGLRVAGSGGSGYQAPERTRQVGLGFQGVSTVEEALERGWKQVSEGIFDTLVPLAKGGIVTSPTAALIGEAGQEAVIPLSQYNQMMRGGNGAQIVNNYNITVQSSSRVGGAQAGEEVVNALKTYNTNNGDFNRALTGFGA